MALAAVVQVLQATVQTLQELQVVQADSVAAAVAVQVHLQLAAQAAQEYFTFSTRR